MATSKNENPDSDEPPGKVPVEIPASVLSAEALRSLIDHFIEREGTDYGAVEARYETKFSQILGQIESGKVMIIFEPESETVNLVPRELWEKSENFTASSEP